MSSISDIFKSSSSESSLNLLEDLSSSQQIDLAKIAKDKQQKEEEEDKMKKEMEDVKKENTELKNKIKHLETIIERYEKTLDIFEKEKNQLEDKLYSKFLPVLNAKKEEILRLQKIIENSH